MEDYRSALSGADTDQVCSESGGQKMLEETRVDVNKRFQQSGTVRRCGEIHCSQQEESSGYCLPKQDVPESSEGSVTLHGLRKYATFGYEDNNEDDITTISEGENSGEISPSGGGSPINDKQDWYEARNSLCELDECKSHRSDVVLRRKWLKVGFFDSQDQMFKEQLQGRVSRWKVKKVRAGWKILYRCNKFKHFGCGYRMYAEIQDRGCIGLYESGSHDHSSRKFKCLKAGARVVVDAKPSSSQQVLLDQFIQNATKNAKSNGTISGITPSTSAYAPSPLSSSKNVGCEQEIFDTKGLAESSLLSTKSGKPFSPKMEHDEGDDSGESDEPLYLLSDGSNIAELLHVANDMDLAFTYNSRRTGEFCFESNAQNMRGRLVVFADLGNKVAVRERYNGCDLSYEEWKKADWKQFLWAVRGKCMNVLRGL